MHENFFFFFNKVLFLLFCLYLSKNILFCILWVKYKNIFISSLILCTYWITYKVFPLKSFCIITQDNNGK